MVVAAEHRPVTSDTPRDPLIVHVGRVLVLIDAFTGRTSALRGLAKLARLDFLLRFPVYLEAALSARGRPLSFDLRPNYDERWAPEGARIRWKYGPWDHRYYPLLGRLVGQGLIRPERIAGDLVLRSTDSGHEAVAALLGAEWDLVRGRAAALKRGADLHAERLAALIAPLLETDEVS